ncbi:alpha-tocopherol transfer protein-like [Eupeodes corollae]|uniref:alpha-tocopherol transfer protein-like n=1 Tax=Eupeodes corollae TaxID=290404 RepID=UPI0024919EF2|nr:alpha-tocopherol transfer protein-like [Eupeodes corollae]
MSKVRPLTPELALKAREELHEVENRIADDIAALRTWIIKQPHLHARTDDQFLLSFLRGCKFSMEKAKQKVDYYYTIKTMSPEIFLNKQIDDRSMRLARHGHIIPLPTPLKPDGPRIHITRYANVNPKEFTILDLFKNQLRIFEIQMFEDDNCVIGGVLNVADLGNIPKGLILQFDPVLIKKLSVFADKAAPIRIKGMHLINVPKEAAALINIARSLMSKKIRERLIVHSSLESLYKYIPQDYLPEDYGGHNGSLQDAIDIWEKRLLRYREFFEEDVQYKANEKARIGSRMSPESLFGLEGSFRKLEVD